MDIVNRIDRGDPEDQRLEYKSEEVTNRKIALELTAFANHQGGVVVLGVRDNTDGEPDIIQNVSKPHERTEAVTNVIYERVEPNLDFDSDTVLIDGNTLLVFEVGSSEVLHSFRDDTIGEPIYPVRRNTRVGYLQGHEIEQHYREQLEQVERETRDDLLRLPEGEHSNYFIKAPDGHISDICIFSNVYHPGDPVRIHLRIDYQPEIVVEHVFAILDEIFQLSRMESSFTINQSNAAWIGEGFQNFVHNLRAQEKRYEEVSAEQEYELALYGNEQAVLVSELGNWYPESTVLIYAAPFAEDEGYRHLSINFLIDGYPVDVRPLVEFLERANLHLSTAKEISIPTDGIPEPSRIPVEVLERSVGSIEFPDGEHQSIKGAVCANPFFDEFAFLDESLDIEGVSPLTKYDRIFGYLIDWDDTDEPHEYTAKRFLVTDWNEFTRGIYANVKEVRFDINW